MHFNVTFTTGSKSASREVLQILILNLNMLLHKTAMWNSETELKKSRFQIPCDRDTVVLHSSL